VGARPRRKIKTNEKEEKKVIVCEVEFDCELHSNKSCYFEGINPLKQFDLDVVTQKDISDVNSCIKLGVDYLIMPHVRNQADVKALKDLLSMKGRNIKILSKINDRIALQNIENILEESYIWRVITFNQNMHIISKNNTRWTGTSPRVPRDQTLKLKM